MGAEALINDRAIIGMYYNGLEQGDMSWVNDLAFDVDSNQDEENHVWLGMPPGFREWVGGRHAKSFLDFDYTIKNKDFESTIEYHERHLSQDKTSQLQVRINQHADRALSHEASLMSALILGAESSVCYDGQYFFDTDHTEGNSGTQSNDISIDISTLAVGTHGSTARPSVGEMSECILQSIETMYGFKDDQGEPLNENAQEFLVMTPITLFGTALKAINNVTMSNGETNILAQSPNFKIKVKANPRLTWTDKFATFRMDGAVKPFIKQIREPLTIDVLGRGTEYNFETRKVKVGLKKAGNVGLGLWQGAVLTTMT